MSVSVHFGKKDMIQEDLMGHDREENLNINL